MEESIDELDSKITIRSSLKFLTDLKKNLQLPGNDNRNKLFQATIFEADGSARVKIGNTEVIVTVKAKLGTPTASAPYQGKVSFNINFSTTAGPEFEGRGGDKLSMELSTALRVCLLGGITGAGSGIDLSSLSIVDGKICWDLCIDGLVISMDGDVLDALGVKEYHTIHMEVVFKDPNPEVSLEMSLLLYPAISQMLRTFLSSPQLRKQIIGQNPPLRSLFVSNLELTDWIQNHKIVRCLTSPQMMQLLEFPRQSSIRHSTPSEDAAAGPSTSFKAMPPESQLELPRPNSVQHSTLSEDAAADQSTSFKTMAPESQLELPRQNLVQHSTHRLV